MLFRLPLVLSTLVLCAGCGSMFGGQKPTTVAEPPAATHSVTAGLERYLEQRARVEAVGFRLRRAAAASCAGQEKTKPDLGLIVWSLANFPNAEDRAFLQRRFTLTENVTVALAVAGGPAETAGVKTGAVVTHVNGAALPQGKGATEKFIVLSNTAAKEGPVDLRFADGGATRIKPQAVCDFPTLLVRSPEINAAADGRVLAITTGLFDLTRSDDELALILGHELAHNALGHLREEPIAKARPGILDAFMRATIGTAVASTVTPPFSLENEKDADYVGLYFMARAGYNLDAAESFWRRLNETTRANAVAKTHPTGPERLNAIQAAIAEIKAKKRAKKPLETDLKRPR